MKIALTDVETTGLDSKKHEILEIGLVVFDSEPLFEIYDTLDIKVKPEHIETAEPKALEINGYNKADWEEALPLKEAMELYWDKAQGCMFASHNVAFDYSFIGPCPHRFDTSNYHKLDTFTLAWIKIPHDKIKRWNLKSICEYLEIEPEPAVHRGINGAQAAYNVYTRLMSGTIGLL